MTTISTIAARTPFREELERAMSKYEKEGGEVQSLPILPDRENFLRYRGAEFDKARTAAAQAKSARQSAARETPNYLRNLRAYANRKRS